MTIENRWILKEFLEQIKMNQVDALKTSNHTEKTSWKRLTMRNPLVILQELIPLVNENQDAMLGLFKTQEIGHTAMIHMNPLVLWSNNLDLRLLQQGSTICHYLIEVRFRIASLSGFYVFGPRP